MDTSKQYIEMCEKAKEIQALWEPRSGDFIFSVDDLGNEFEDLDKYIAIVGVNNGPRIPNWYHNWYGLPLTSIWLPRQDQLQEMCEGHWTEVLGKFTYWLDGPSPLVSIPTKKLLKERVDFVKRLEQINSMEQLWLAFVMKEKYGKVWNGTDWVKGQGEKK